VRSYDSQARKFFNGRRLTTEAIDQMRVIEGKLIIPETDRTGLFWFHSDVHIFDGKRWTFVRIPRAVHVFDVAGFNGSIYVSYQYDSSYDKTGPHRVAVINDGKLIEAKSIGQANSGRIWRLTVCEKRLFAFPTQDGHGLMHDGNKWRKMAHDSRTRGVITASESDGKTAVLIGQAGKYYANYRGGHRAWSLGADGKLKLINQFKDRHAVDVKIHAGTYYVMAYIAAKPLWRTQVFQSTDLNNWTSIISGKFSSAPLSMEVHDGAVYIGLADGKLWTGSINKKE